MSASRFFFPNRLAGIPVGIAAVVSMRLDVGIVLEELRRLFFRSVRQEIRPASDFLAWTGPK